MCETGHQVRTKNARKMGPASDSTTNTFRGIGRGQGLPGGAVKVFSSIPHFWCGCLEDWRSDCESEGSRNLPSPNENQTPIFGRGAVLVRLGVTVRAAGRTL